MDPSTLQSAFETAEMSLIGRIAEFGSNLAQRERARRTRIRTQIEVEAAHESEPIQQRIAAIEAGNANAQILPILRARLEKIQATRRRRIEELAGDAEPSIGGSTFAAGVVEVVPEIQGDEWQARHS